LQNLVWFKNIDIDSFYPRCFDFTQEEAASDFIEEFKTVKAQSTLMTYVREIRNAFEKGSLNKNPEESGSKSVSEKVLDAALKISQRRLHDIDEMLDDPGP
jgi:tubulin monoglycylase TTLL3/8